MRVAPSLALVLATACVYQLPPLSPRVRSLPARISETGLYADASLTTVSADAVPYTPSFELWSDGATKRRWIRVPPGTTIDTSHMDAWVLPVGTELWKEFSVDGRRIETRLLTRLDASEDGWVGVAYAWNQEQTEALATIDGANDALETAHDVPEARACMTCHAGRASVALGFSAVQLAHAAPAGELSLDALVAGALISDAPATPIVVPGDAATVAALGYLHANCGSCHNADRPTHADAFRPPTTLDLWLTTEALGTPRATRTYQTAVSRFVTPGAPERSPLLSRMESAPFPRRSMPPIAVERVDAHGIAVVARWIRGLEPADPP